MHHYRWPKFAGTVAVSLPMLLLPACSGNKGAHSCTDDAAQANALEYVRRDLFKFFPEQAATMDGKLLALESIRILSNDEARGETTCAADLSYRVGEMNLKAAVGYSWAPGGRDGAEYSARIWPAAAAP